MLEDLRYAFRHLRKNPGFAVVAVMTLGIGIGAATAMFGLIQGVLLSPPPYADPGRLVLLSPTRIDGLPYNQGSTTGHWLAWRKARTIDPPALYRWTFNFMVLPDGSESLGGMVVTHQLLPDAGGEATARPRTRPTRRHSGRRCRQPPSSSDTTCGGGSSTATPGSSGRTITLSRMPAPLPIVGVMPPGVRFLPDPGAASEPNYDVDAPRGLLPGHDRRRGTPGARRWQRRGPAAPGGLAGAGAGGDCRERGGARRPESRPAGPDRDRTPAPGRPQPRRPAVARAAVRLGRAGIRDRLRERRRTVAGAGTAAPAGVRDAVGARGGTMAAVPAVADREPGAGAGQRHRRRGTRRRPSSRC